MKRWLVALALMVAPALHAQTLEMCTQYASGTSGPWFRNLDNACSARAASETATNPTYSFSPVSSSLSPLRCVFAATLKSTGASAGNTNRAMVQRTGVYCEPEPPPTPADCDEDAPGVGETFTSSEDVSAGNTSYCNSVTQCRMSVKSSVTAGGTTVHTVTHTTANCDDPPQPPMSNDDLEEGETCTAVGDGEYCASPEGDGDCGYMNDTYICLAKVKPNECKTLGDGGRVCGTATRATPPIPDNGTPGTPATPDGTITNNPTGGGSPVTYNYYNSTTVAGSARDPGTTGGATTGGSPGNDAEEQEDEEVGGGCDLGECDETLPELEDIGTMTEAFTGFWGDLQDVPIVAAAADIAPSFGEGMCPVWEDSVNVYGESIELEFSFICDTWEDVTPALSIVALVLWGFLAFRVLMSA